jgi:hypothetical protein
MQKFMKFFISILIVFNGQLLIAKDKKTIDYRIYTASLWIDNLKMPITSGKAVWVDSMFVIFKANKELSLNDVHSNVILQINDSKATGTRAVVVDYDLASGWMLAEVKKQAVSTPRQKLGDQQVVDLLAQNDLIDHRDKNLSYQPWSSLTKIAIHVELPGTRIFTRCWVCKLRTTHKK